MSLSLLRPSVGRRPVATVIFALLVGAACIAFVPSSPAAPAPPTGVVNLGLADSLGYRVSGDGFVAFTVDESAQGIDLNGNGSATDVAVWHVMGLDGTATNLGLAGPPTPNYGTANGPGFVFAVDETAQKTDLNGDGIATDPAVWHVYTPPSGVTNLGLAADHDRIWRWSGGFAFHVDEPAQGADLNGDGDSLDLVWHVYDWDSGTTNLGLAVTAVLVGNDVTVGDGVLVWASELHQGNTDLNGDGDATDPTVWHLWDPIAGVTNLALAGPDPIVRSYGSGAGFMVSEVFHNTADLNDLNGDGDDLDHTVWHVYLPGSGVTNLGLTAGSPAMSSPIPDGFLFSVGEPAQGATDLNGDSDANDQIVWHVYREGTGVVNLGLANGTTGAARLPDGLAFQVSEESQGGTDLNGDLDADDQRVWHVYRTATGVTNLGLAADMTGDPFADGFAFTVNEPFQGGADLNGDLDAADTRVLHVYTPATGVINVGLATTGHPEAGFHGSLLFKVQEGFQGNVDLNGDGDTTDGVWHVYRVGVGSTNLGLAPGFPVGAVPVDGGFAFTVAEASQGSTDLNGDGDATDNAVWHHYHPADGVTDLQIAGNFKPGSFAEASTGGLLVVTVDEMDQAGASLNGDGDTLDDVRHAVFLCSGRLPDWLGSPAADTHVGSAAGEVLVGLGGADDLKGAGGDDLICAGPGADLVNGGAGTDVLRGGDGNDTIQGKAGSDQITGGPGNDKLNGGPDDDILTGGPGKDQAVYFGAPGGVTVDLAAGTATGHGTDTLSAIENVMGSPGGHDVIWGDGSANLLKGLGGKDTLVGRGGSDRLIGAAGNDTIRGGAGGDKLFGKAGRDRIFGGLGNDLLEGNVGDDKLDGGAGTDTLKGGADTDVCIDGEMNHPSCETVKSL